MTVFQREEAIKSNELERDVNGLIQKDTRKRKFKDRSFVIEHYSRLLQDNKITATRFLKTMVNMDNKVVFQEHEYPILDLDEIDFANNVDKEKMKSVLGKPDDSDKSPIVLSASENDCQALSVESRGHQASRQKMIEDSPILTRSKARKRMATESQQTATTQNAFVTQSAKRTRKDGDRAAEPLADSLSRNSITCDIEAVTKLTSTASEIHRLNEKFNEIISSSEIIKMNTSTCIMGCNREKATVLLPCTHQPTCNQCFVLYKMFLSEKKMKHFCPVCKVDIISHIAIAMG